MLALMEPKPELIVVPFRPCSGSIRSVDMNWNPDQTGSEFSSTSRPLDSVNTASPVKGSKALTSASAPTERWPLLLSPNILAGASEIFVARSERVIAPSLTRSEPDRRRLFLGIPPPSVANASTTKEPSPPLGRTPGRQGAGGVGPDPKGPT